MKILVTGAAGQVGHALLRQPRRDGIGLVGCRRTDLDILDPVAVNALIQREAPDVVVNAAAYTAVDAAEDDAEAAYAVNRDGPANLAHACVEYGAAMIHLSTDYVFDGNATGQRAEEDATCPLGVYGRSKLAGEETVRSVLERHVVLRLSWVFGEHGKNFVKTIVNLARGHEEVRVVADQHGCPTYTGHIADAILEIAARLPASPVWGTFHYRGAPSTTWHGFAEVIIESARRQADDVVAKRVIPVETAAFPTPARRPANSVLNCTRLENHYGIRPQRWSEGVDSVVAAALR